MDNSHHNEDGHHLIPYGAYVAVWLTLVFFTGITIAVAYVDMKHAAISVAVLIASVKCTIVIMYFMHIRYERPIFTWFLLTCIVTFGIFLALSFADYWYR